MITPEILKKLNLKAVPFSEIGEGQTFNILVDFATPDCVAFLQRRLVGDNIEFHDGSPCCVPAKHHMNTTVYVPVWRPTKEIVK